jgi:hypothetical protein
MYIFTLLIPIVLMYIYIYIYVYTHAFVESYISPVTRVQKLLTKVNNPPSLPKTKNEGHLAQLVEQRVHVSRVVGSSPAVTTSPPFLPSSL